MSPIQLFNDWYQQELECSTLKLPAACCLSTIGLDGYPNARFVSLKDVKQDGFVVTGSLASRKGLELQYINKAALTFWWTETERQVRIQGDVRFISNAEAERYFQERNRDAQIVSYVSEQGEELPHQGILEMKYNQAEIEFKDRAIERPSNWGGFLLRPLKIEFLSFKKTRFHQRILFEKAGSSWNSKSLQP